MNENEVTSEEIQLCSIRIAFPVKTDDEAIEYKKKIGNVLADIPQARIEFNLTTVPVPIKKNASSTTKPD